MKPCTLPVEYEDIFISHSKSSPIHEEHIVDIKYRVINSPYGEEVNAYRHKIDLTNLWIFLGCIGIGFLMLLPEIFTLALLIYASVGRS